MRLPLLTFAAAALALGTGVAAASDPGEYTNPVLPGDWSDPGVIRVGDDFYTCRSTFGWQPGIFIAHSRDLLSWRYIGHAFTTLDVLVPGDTRGGIWGVEMGYNPHTKQFLIFAPTRTKHLYVFSADRPEGPYAMKHLGPDYGIDPGYFVDDDGRQYLVLNKGVIFELSRDGLSVEREVARVQAHKYKLFEGPDIFKHGGWYYLLFSDGGTLPREPSTISTLRARRLEGPWEEDPNNPVMFSTDSGAKFEAPAHGTLIETNPGEWYITYHAHETAYYSLGREMLMDPIEWTKDGWWRPVHGKIPSERARAPRLPREDYSLAQSDDFEAPTLGLQWFFTCPPDLSGETWSLNDRKGWLRITPAPGDIGSASALPAIFQQRVIDKAFTVETRLEFAPQAGGEAAGLHFFHDSGMNFWIAARAEGAEGRIEIGKYNLGRRTVLWSTRNPHGSRLRFRIAVDGEERATFFHAGDTGEWIRLGESVYFGASGIHLRNNQRGDPDLGWVGRYKDPTVSADVKAARPGGNVWTATTFGVFAVRNGTPKPTPALFDYIKVTKP